MADPTEVPIAAVPSPITTVIVAPAGSGPTPTDPTPAAGLGQTSALQTQLEQRDATIAGLQTTVATLRKGEDERLATSFFGAVEKILVYAVCVGVLLLAGLALHSDAARVTSSYDRVTSELNDLQTSRVAGQPAVSDRNHIAATVTLMGLRDVAVMRDTILFLAFIAILMGCLLVLKGVEATYKLGLTTGDKSSALSTSSPGLILITAGTLLVLFLIRDNAVATLNLGGDGAPPAPPPAATTP